MIHGNRRHPRPDNVKFRFLARTVSFAFALSLSAPVGAQGLYAGSKGARVMGRAGAFGAKADDLSAVEYNPAGLTYVEKTDLQLSNRFSYNQTKFQRVPTLEDGEIVSFDGVKNQTPWQGLEPLLGVVSNFGLKDFAFAATAYAPAGTSKLTFSPGSVEADEEGAQRYMMVERESAILIYALSTAYKYRDVFGVGATFQWIHVPRLNYSLIVAPVGFGIGADKVNAQFDMQADVAGSDPFIPNAVVGAWVQPIKQLRLSLSGQVIPAEIKSKSTIHVARATSGAELDLVRDDPNTPTRETEPVENDVELRVPLPLWARAGAQLIQDKFDLELNVTWHGWSRVDTFVLDSLVGGVGLSGSLGGATIPIDVVNIEKNWKNTLTFQLGGDVQVIADKLTLRAGVAYETPTADKASAHVDFATGHHFTGAVGASLFIKKFELAAAFAHRRQVPINITEAEGAVYVEVPGTSCEPPYDSVSCPYPGQPSGTVNGGNHQSFSHFLALDGIYRF